MSEELYLSEQPGGFSAEDYDAIKEAIVKLSASSQSQFDEIKKEKWFTRLFDMVTFSQKGKERIATQIGTIAQAQEILIEMLLRLSSNDKRVSDIVFDSLNDIQKIQEQNIYLLSRIKRLENVTLGINSEMDIKLLSDSAKKVLTACIYHIVQELDSVSQPQQRYANSVFEYLRVDTQIDNLSSTLSNVDESSRRMILTCCLEYLFLNNYSFDLCKRVEPFIEDFDLGNKTIKGIQEHIIALYKLRGEDGFVSKYKNESYEKIDDSFQIEFWGTNEIADSVGTNELSEEWIDTIIHIEQNESCYFSNKRIYFSALIACEGTLCFENCEIICREGAEILLEKGANLTFDHSKITDEGDLSVNCIRVQKKYFFASESSYFVKSCNFHQAGRVRVCGCSIDFPANFIWISGTNSIEITNSLFANINPGVINVEAEECLFSDNSFLISKETELSSERSPFLDFIHVDAKTFVLKNCYFEAKDGYFAGDAEHHYSSNYLVSSTSGSPSTAVNCTFHGVPACIHGFSAVEKCLFENCRNTWEWAHGVLGGIEKITNCIFDQCRGVVFAAEDSTISDCQFVNCGSDLIISRDKAGVSIKYCKFRNISEDFVNDDMHKNSAGGVIWLSRNKKSKNKRCNEITGCTFSDINSGTYIINRYGDDVPYKKTIVLVSNCAFSRCKNRNSPNELVRTEYLAKNSKVKCVCVCSGIQTNTNSGMDVSGEMPILEQIAPEMKTNNGEMIGYLY